MNKIVVSFPFFTSTELRAVAPKLASTLSEHALHLGNEQFHLAGRITASLSAYEHSRRRKVSLRVAGVFSFSDADGQVWEIEVTQEQRDLLLRAAEALNAPAANVLEYVLGFTDIHPARKQHCNASSRCLTPTLRHAS